MRPFTPTVTVEKVCFISYQNKANTPWFAQNIGYDVNDLISTSQLSISTYTEVGFVWLLVDSFTSMVNQVCDMDKW